MPGGLSLETARAIALRSPRLIILASRTPSKLQDAQKTLESSAPKTPTCQLVIDLGTFAKVRKAAEEVNSWANVPWPSHLSTLRMALRASLQQIYLGHFLFTYLMIGQILAAGEG